MEHLRNQVKSIIDNLETGITYGEAGLEVDAEANGYDLDDIISGFDYLQDALDIEYIVSSSKKYLGARVLVAFGGPNIWINTRTKQVEGYWAGDSCILRYYDDAMCFDETLEELFQC